MPFLFEMSIRLIAPIFCIGSENSAKLRQSVPTQARVYPNLNPAAAIPVDRNQIFLLESFFDHFRLKGRGHGHYVPNAKYVFVRMGTGETLLHPTYRHPALAEGKPTIYAGEAFFDNGKLTWWSNASGNYRPDPDHAEQAALPMERFFPFEDVMRGLHKSPTRSTNAREVEAMQLRTGGPRAIPWVTRR
jgi:hypothetical protein